MEKDALIKYNAFDGFKRASNLDDIVRIVLDEQKHTLTEEDQRILRDRENLRNEFHTLQNVDLACSNASPSKSDGRNSPLWSDLTHAEPSTSNKSDVYFVDVAAIEQPQAAENVESSNTELDNTIANFIQDENVKIEVLRMNQQIRLNSMSIRVLHDDAKSLMMEKLNLKRKLAIIERKIANFSPEEVRIKRIKRKKGTDSANTGHQKRTYFYRFGAPYFKTKDRFPADRNPDLCEIIRTDQLMNIRLPRSKRILSHDATFLENGVLKQLKVKRVQQLQKCLKDADNRRKQNPANKALDEEIRCIVRTIKETEEIAHISATKDWNIPVDFMALNETQRFSADDYERIWKLTGSPTLTRGEFSEQEVTELKSLAKKYKEQDWDQIASEMSTNRSGFMCFTKYVSTQKKGKNQPWTKEENDLLHHLCSSMDSVSKSDSRFQFWKNIRCHFPDRTYTQIHSHWTYVLEPRLKKGRFTPEESKLMMKMMSDGKSYREIAQTMQNRSVVQVRTHLEALLQKEVSRGNWSPEEEEKLLLLVEKYGSHDWVTISKELGTRNRSQCRLKYSLYLKNNQRFSAGTRAPKEFWTEEENRQFKELVFKYGSNFTKMSGEMSTKTREQLRYKYHRTKHKAEFHNVVSVEEVKNSWSDEEVGRFKQLLMIYGVQYKLIAQILPTKTVCQLRHKYSTMKNKWNLPLPSTGRSADKRSINAVSKCNGTSLSLHNTSVSTPSASLPVTYITEPSKTPPLPEGLFENLVPIFGANAASPQTDESQVLSSDPLFISSEEQTKLAASRSKSRQRKPSSTLKYWTPDEVEQFKQLLMVHGPDFRKISSIMVSKSSTQLRWKHYSMKEKWGSSVFPAAVRQVMSKSRKTSATPEVVANRKNLCKSKQKQLPQQEGEKSYENLANVIFEVSLLPSSPDVPSEVCLVPSSSDVPSDVPSEGVAEEDKSTRNTAQPERPKSSSLKAVWTDDELLQFKRLLMEYGLQYKKIGGIMTGKTISQLRYKYTCLKNAGEVPCLADASRLRAKRRKMSTPSVPVSRQSFEQPLPVELFGSVAVSNVVSTSQPVFVTSEEHSMFSNSSNLSMFVDSEDGFAGFPDESRESPLSFRNLIPVEPPGSSCEQMIVPERIVEVRSGELSDVGSNDCLPANGNGSVAESASSAEDIELADGTVEVKCEIVADEIKEEKRDEFAA